MVKPKTKYAKDMINPRVLAVAFAVTAFIFAVAAYVLHGLLKVPSFIEMVHPGFWGNPALLAWGLACTVLGAFVLGYVLAWVYNWAVRKF